MRLIYLKKLNYYVSSFTIKESVQSFAAASHLWHLSHIFRALDFKINGVTRNSLVVKGSFRSALKNSADNMFAISISDSDKARADKLIELISFILYDRYPNIKISFKLSEQNISVSFWFEKMVISQSVINSSVDMIDKIT